MPKDQLIGIIIMLIMSGIFAFLSFRSFKEKGFLFNNAYLYATEEERKTMNKKPWYRQTAIASCLLSVACILMVLHMVFGNKIFLILQVITIIGAVLYAIISSVVIIKRENKQ